MPCGFCGMDFGCTTKLITGTGNKAAIIDSDCLYYYMDYKTVINGRLKNSPCSNVPIHCELCPVSSEGNPATIWKYNTLMHVLIEHEGFDDDNICVIPEIPLNMQREMYISRAEELSLGVSPTRTAETRNDFNLLNSDDIQTKSVPPLATNSKAARKRPRTYTVSKLATRDKKARK